MQAREAMKILPPRIARGLFYDPKPDETFPPHHATFLNSLKNKLEVKPDGQLENIKKCDVEKCLNVFRIRTDADRHERIFHDECFQIYIGSSVATSTLIVQFVRRVLQPDTS